MKTKPLWRISIATTPEAEDAVAQMLGALSARAAVSYHNLESGMSTSTVYCDARPAAAFRHAIHAGLARIRGCALNIGPGRITIARVQHEDWAESWKRHFNPIEIFPAGARRSVRPLPKSLLIKPSWSRHRPRRHQAVVVLDPGLSFGTGRHATTSFCLREIVRRNLRPKRSGPPAPQSFLDIGTGSGILAIAAAKLGCKPVHAFDVDANAIQIARVNARRNHVAGKIRFWRGDVAKLPRPPVRKFDLICANLISDLLIAARRPIAARLMPGGTLVAAGILKSDFQNLQAAFAKVRLKLVSSKTEKEWHSGSFQLHE